MSLVLGIRYPWAGLRSLRKPSVGLLDTVRVRMRVRLRDCDVNLHINNGRYLSLMDIGRIDLSGRSGLISLARARGWNAVAAGVTIRFRRELRWRSRYVLVTRCVGWSDGWAFFEQTFERANGDLAARALVKVAVLDRDRQRVPIEQIAEALGAAPQSPPLPDDVLQWQRIAYG